MESNIFSRVCDPVHSRSPYPMMHQGGQEWGPTLQRTGEKGEENYARYAS